MKLAIAGATSYVRLVVDAQKVLRYGVVRWDIKYGTNIPPFGMVAAARVSSRELLMASTNLTKVAAFHSKLFYHRNLAYFMLKSLKRTRLRQYEGPQLPIIEQIIAYCDQTVVTEFACANVNIFYLKAIAPSRR
jgi:hypothetical protein